MKNFPELAESSKRRVGMDPAHKTKKPARHVHEAGEFYNFGPAHVGGTRFTGSQYLASKKTICFVPTGQIPPELANLRALTSLDLSQNKLDGESWRLNVEFSATFCGDSMPHVLE